jgi:DNA-binding NarL/FixJ family response regulator
MKILIAGDNLRIRQVLRPLIEGHEDWDVCAEAEDGVQAVNRAKQFKPDLIMTFALDFSLLPKHNLARRSSSFSLSSAQLVIASSSALIAHTNILFFMTVS